MFLHLGTVQLSPDRGDIMVEAKRKAIAVGTGIDGWQRYLIC